MPLRSEADLVAALHGTIRLDDLYAAAEAAGLDRRDNGGEVIHGRSDTRCRRRVRNALQSARRQGRARRVDRSTWILDDGGGSDRRRLVLLWAPGDRLAPVELAVCDAAELLGELADDQTTVDLIVADPPWALGRTQTGDRDHDGSERLYAASRVGRVVEGYVDVPAHAYRQFTRRWVAVAAELLGGRPGGYLAMITGPQQAGWLQVAAEDAGLTYVSSIVAKKAFPLYSTRRPAFAHYVVTLVCSGALDSPKRFYAPGGAGQQSKAGRPVSTTWWDSVGRADRPGLLTYDNALPPHLVRRLISATTDGPEHGAGPWTSTVVDPFCGGGETAMASVALRRQFIGADVNPQAVRYSAGRLLDEAVWPAEDHPSLFDTLSA